jgi:hypothetical protein
MMNGTPMIYQESDCYREIEPDGMFFKFKKDLFEMLDKLLDNEEFRKEREVMAINRCSELSKNNDVMLQLLHSKLTDK